MKYLFGDWVKVSSRIQKFSRIFLFFDYDGTLTPIVATPELAKISPAVRNSLKRLKKDPKFKLAIISGRSLANVKKMAGVKGIIYAGNHGLEIEDLSDRVGRMGIYNNKEYLSPRLDKWESLVYNLLSSEPQHIDELSGALKLKVSEISSILLNLEMKKLASQLPVKNFVKEN